MDTTNALSAADVATRYGIPVRTVQEACREKRLPSERFGRSFLIAPDDARHYARAWAKLHVKRNGHLEDPDGDR